MHKDANAKQISALQLDNMSLRGEVRQLKISLEILSFDQSTLKKDENKVSFLAGLPYYQWRRVRYFVGGAHVKK